MVEHPQIRGNSLEPEVPPDAARAHKEHGHAALMQQAKRTARGFRTAACFFNIAYLRLGKLVHLPASPEV